ncbi:acetylxylan esterase [Actinoplanes utahensis]|uniref:acetylxylan esterase n=1 Tax=Actinoplanes utahensis TaxID=1869 RepID=UPI00068F6E51|nr:acetylxylan esterase [Actinoplanes utahensis]GIF30797.1 acetylxylan esterase [Actinoplanes utahensis]
MQPPDFDTFWRTTLAESAGPIVLDVRPVPNDLDLLDCWDVTFGGFGGHPVRAWYTRPAGHTEPLPAIVEYAGYGRGRGLPHERLTWPAAGYAHLLMDNRGQGDQYGSGGDTPDPAGVALGGPGPVTRGILSPADYYYRRLIADAVRAVHAVRELPGADPDRVAVVGNSQGGLLALAAAGLIPDLAAALVSAPFLCDIERGVEHASGPPYAEISAYLAVHRDAEEAVWRTLSYVDGVSFARRATAPGHFGIGLRDTVCPPVTGRTAYEQYGAAAPVRPTRAKHEYRFNGHEHGEAYHVRHQLRWLARTLAAPGASPTADRALDAQGAGRRADLHG